MRKILLLSITVFLLCTLQNTTALAFSKMAKITIAVIDENGKPVSGAKVGVGFQINSGSKENAVDGITGADGRFSASAGCNGYLGFRVNKDGYYFSYGKYEFLENKQFSMKWDPWNPEAQIVLRKIEKQVPMFARNTAESKIEVPVLGKDVGFDLVKFDWVGPYGVGVVTDFTCNLTIMDKANNDYEYNAKVKFPGKYNGIIAIKEDLQNGSEFKLPRYAPEYGYIKELNLHIKRLPSGFYEESFKDNTNYIFRVRSVIVGGKLVKAMYGKVIGDFDLKPKLVGTAGLIFKYYLNPDFTKNLEFDATRNLFGTLPLSERVRIN